MNRARERIESRTLGSKSSASVGVLTSSTVEDMSSTMPLPAAENNYSAEFGEDNNLISDPTYDLSQPMGLLTIEANDNSASRQSVIHLTDVVKNTSTAVSGARVNEDTVFEWVPERRKSVDSCSDVFLTRYRLVEGPEPATESTASTAESCTQDSSVPEVAS